MDGLGTGGGVIYCPEEAQICGGSYRLLRNQPVQGRYTAWRMTAGNIHEIRDCSPDRPSEESLASL